MEWSWLLTQSGSSAMNWLKRKLLSQNFLRNRQLVKRLVRGSSIQKTDLVLEIGPGDGIITDELAFYAGEVAAVEIDAELVHNLRSKLAHMLNVHVIHDNFLNVPLPDKPYKIFSNLPFRFTGEILKKIFLANSTPDDSYLILQKEAAYKFAGKPHQSFNNQITVLLWPWFEIKIIHRFHSNDFFPRPNVEIVLLQIKKRTNPFLPLSQTALFRDFVCFTFGQLKSPTQLDCSKWVELFNFHQAQSSDRKKRQVAGAFMKWRIQQSNLQKIHRTRNDPNWKKQGFPIRNSKQ